MLCDKVHVDYKGIGQNEELVATVNSSVNISTTHTLAPCMNIALSEFYSELRKD